MFEGGCSKRYPLYNRWYFKKQDVSDTNMEICAKQKCADTDKTNETKQEFYYVIGLHQNDMEKQNYQAKTFWVL